ncbi:DUF2975 domain-containing protein [Isoptericola sp. b515]|uniref:DUF2975 domain-containing protein n=1 Tax=Isoptericola sp. b515 TaxID=3064652 RepID=UPI002713C72A|nr:DUF2975 domain-containing protein [Isoptericola sp. b515]MDO8148292.1 DUF2975 domain-containing protein [Isoptericola sp. b515]
MTLAYRLSIWRRRRTDDASTPRRTASRAVTVLTVLAAVAALLAGTGALVADNILVPVTGQAATTASDDGRHLLGGTTTSTLTIVEPTAGERLWVFAPAVAWCLTAVACGLLLRRVVRTTETGDAFHPDNARHLRQVGTVVLGGGLLAAAVATAGHLVLVRDAVAAGSLTAPGATVPAGEVVVPVTAFAVAATLWGVAVLLRHGAAMRDELRGLV